VSDTEWTDPRWLAEARAWIDAQGVELAGPVEQPHVRPWSTALRLSTTEGVLWFKANHPSLVHEARVVAIISRRRPDLVPELVAADLGRGWMLMRDGGERLREVVERERGALARSPTAVRGAPDRPGRRRGRPRRGRRSRSQARRAP
jgi:hypothetical protein